jgi:hypothetical protein
MIVPDGITDLKTWSQQEFENYMSNLDVPFSPIQLELLKIVFMDGIERGAFYGFITSKTSTSSILVEFLAKTKKEDELMYNQLGPGLAASIKIMEDAVTRLQSNLVIVNAKHTKSHAK